METTDTSGDESVISLRKNKVLAKKIDIMKRAWASDELPRLFVTCPTDAAAKPGHFYCQLCWCDVCVLNHWSFEILRQNHGAKHFAMDQRLRLKTLGWRVLNVTGIVCQIMKFNVRGGLGSCGHLLCNVIVNILFARIYSRMMLVLSIRSCPFWRKFRPCWKFCNWVGTMSS